MKNGRQFWTEIRQWPVKTIDSFMKERQEHALPAFRLLLLSMPVDFYEV